MLKPPWVQAAEVQDKELHRPRRSRSPVNRSRSRSPIRRGAPLPSQDSQKPQGASRYGDRRIQHRNDDGHRTERQHRSRSGHGAAHDAQAIGERPPEEREKPNFGLSGALAAESNIKQGIVLKYHEPAEAAKPRRPWRLYVYKGKTLEDTLHLSQQSAYLLGRDAAVADIPLPDASCSKQHAVVQFRQVGKKDEYGTMQKQVKPYLIDLGSTNGSYVNRKEVPSERFYELRSTDSLAFGDDEREFVLLEET